MTATNRTTAELRELSRELYDIAQPLEGKTPFGKLVRIADRLTTLTLSLPQPPALGGIVEETNLAVERLSVFARSYPEVLETSKVDGHPLLADIATICNAYPTLRANLKQEEWRPELRTDWENAPRDRSPVLLKFKPDAQISWRSNWPPYIVGRHSGLPEDSDVDFNGWGMPGVGGWIDSDFEGFLPLPTPPQSKKEG